MAIHGIIFDLDGTVYRGNEAVPGAASFIADMRGKGIQPLFVTNRANRPPSEVATHLDRIGIPCSNKDVLTSAQATARHLKQGTAFMIGETGLRIELEEQGIVLTEKDPDYVIVSFDTELTYAKLDTATRLISRGAQFIATNPDKGLRTESGISPGTGAIVAAVSTATGMKPLIIGKPEKLIMEMAAVQLRLPAEKILAIGDNMETDIPAAAQAGMRSALILTGISTRKDAEAGPIQPTWIADDYPALQSLISQEIA